MFPLLASKPRRTINLFANMQMPNIVPRIGKMEAFECKVFAEKEIFVFEKTLEWECALHAHLSMLRLKKSLMLLTKHHIKGIANERLPSLKCLMKHISMLQTYVKLLHPECISLFKAVISRERLG